MKRWIVGAAACLALVALATRPAEAPTNDTPAPPATEDAGGKAEGDTERVARSFLMWVLFPLWLGCAHGDYHCHRATKIERTSGVFESLLHLAMAGVAGVPVLLALFAEVDATLIAILVGAEITHEGVAIVDVRYADSLRRIPPVEQHIHGGLEYLPLAVLTLVVLLYPKEAQALASGRFAPRAPRSRPLPVPTWYRNGLVAAIVLLSGFPYLEELVRCARVNPSPLPHHRPAAEDR